MVEFQAVFLYVTSTRGRIGRHDALYIIQFRLVEKIFNLKSDRAR